MGSKNSYKGTHLHRRNSLTNLQNQLKILKKKMLGLPTRLPRLWDSPGKNTGVSCHFLLQCMKVKSESEVTQSCLTLRNPMDCSPPGSSVHGIFQARVLEWVASTFSEMLGRKKQLRDWNELLHFNIYQMEKSKGPAEYHKKG